MTLEKDPCGIMTIPKDHPNYPRKMRELPNMPDVLYCLGHLPDDEAPSVAIVGARLCSGYGHETAYRFGEALAKKGVQIISGMATGIDGYSMRGGVDGGGSVFGVLAGGPDICYPQSNADLYKKIISCGGIISEQPPGTKPFKYYFPTRNRIISALADIVLVVEAKERSGSLITVDFALNQGRSVYAVPGRIGDPLSEGCNRLIAQGAGIACSAESIWQELCILKGRTCPLPDPHSETERRKELRLRRLKALSDTARRIYGVLEASDARTIEELAVRSGLEISDSASAVVELQLADLAREAGRGRFVLA